MIGFVSGYVDELTDSSVIIDNNGIGWEIFVPGSILDGRLHTGDEVKLYTYMSVTENAIGLYGFLTRDDLEVFRLLINVSGVGPKAALGILGTLSADDLRFAVLADDAAQITRAPGVGKKTAQKIVLELKDKFQLEDAFEKKLSRGDGKTDGAAAETHKNGGGDAEADAVQALVSLGYSGAEALKAVRKVRTDDSMDSEAILKAALRFMV